MEVLVINMCWGIIQLRRAQNLTKNGHFLPPDTLTECAYRGEEMTVFLNIVRIY